MVCKWVISPTYEWWYIRVITPTYQPFTTFRGGGHPSRLHATCSSHFSHNPCALMDNRSPYSNSICTHGSLFYWGLFQEKFQAPPPDKAGRPSKDRAVSLKVTPSPNCLKFQGKIIEILPGNRRGFCSFFVGNIVYLDILRILEAKHLWCICVCLHICLL